MSTGNKSIPDLPPVPDPVGGDLYIVQGAVDYRVAAGGAGGLATLGGDGRLNPAQTPPLSASWSTITGKPTTIAGYGITDPILYPTSALNGSNISSGTVGATYIGNLPASKITSGALDSARLTGSYVNFVDAEGSGVARFGAFSATSGGSAASPAFRFGSDANTGMYNSAADVLTFSTGGSNRGSFSGFGLGVTGAISATGNITGYSSDARLKTNIKNIENPMDKLYKIGGYTFDWNLPRCFVAGFKPDNESEHGVLAQEVQKVIPDAVTPAAFDPEYLTVNYARIVPLLIECIKDLQSQIDELKKE